MEVTYREEKAEPILLAWEQTSPLVELPGMVCGEDHGLGYVSL